MAFMPFITAGDPDLETTLAVIRELSDRSVDLIEIGFPYSDPIADGPVIQASYTRALDHGISVQDIFASIESLRTEQVPPLVAMVSYAIVFRYGTEAFLDRARKAGFAGLIVPDLPGDEAGELVARVRLQRLDLIELVAPTTPQQRLTRILESAAGFVYCISVSGTTGVRDQLPEELHQQLQWLKTQTDLPLAVGFGINRPEQVAALRGVADGVIVGSAIVQQLEELSHNSGRRSDVIQAIGDFAAQMIAATRG